MILSVFIWCWGVGSLSYYIIEKMKKQGFKMTVYAGQPHEKIFIICAKRPIILLAIQAIISILEVACFLSA